MKTRTKAPRISDDKALALCGVSNALKQLAGLHGSTTECPEWTRVAEAILAHVPTSHLGDLEYLLTCLRHGQQSSEYPA